MSQNNMKDREEKREELVPEFLGKDGFSLRCAHCGIYTHSLWHLHPFPVPR